MKIHAVSLGCDKNRVDTEIALAGVLEKGHTLTDNPNDADLLVVNTCCFIEDATKESIDAILSLAAAKKDDTKLYVMGCLAERYRAELLEEIPEIDTLLGTADYKRLADLLPEEGKGPSFHGRWLSTPPHYAYLKIAEGCDNRCTYCVIPSIRGSYVSAPMEELLAEAKDLASRGVKELIVIAQDTTRYGEDLYGEKKLPELLEKLCAVDGLQWIRLLYAYPESVTDELIRVLAEQEKIVKYIDMPIQHISDSVLRRMGRKTGREEIETTLKKLRAAHPDFSVRTTLITGFPGETEENYRELQDFVAAYAFERLGVFPYSREEGTPAARLPDQLPREIKERRAEGIMALQMDIHMSRNDRLVGKTIPVIVDQKTPEGYAGRSWADAPDVDGTVFIQTRNKLLPGTILSVSVTRAEGYDLVGVLASEAEEI